MRRALRLFPVYIVVALFIVLFPHPSNGHAWWVNFLYLAYASNLVFFTFPDFQFGLPLVTGHLWSLAVEEQFYLIWPWLVTRLKTRRNILIACLSGAVAALALRLLLSHTLTRSLWFLYLELPTRADSLLLGGAAAMLYRQPNFLPAHLNKVRITGTLAALTYLALCLYAHTFFFASAPVNTWGFTLLALTFACLLLTCLPNASWTGRFLANPFLRFCGRYSYGLYLIQQAPGNYDLLYLRPLFTSHIHSLVLAAILYFLTVLALATALAVLTFHLIEQPFLKLKKRFPDRPRPQTALAA
jgi:peptidoglycan/LPS O-acetylase OafA/YrhL